MCSYSVASALWHEMMEIWMTDSSKKKSTDLRRKKEQRVGSKPERLTKGKRKAAACYIGFGV